MKNKKLSIEDIKHLAKLANLKLADEEIKKYLSQLEETVEYVDNLKELDTASVQPTSSPVNLENVYFKDGEKNKRGLAKDEALKNAKNIKDSYFVVKRIL